MSCLFNYFYYIFILVIKVQNVGTITFVKQVRGNGPKEFSKQIRFGRPTVRLIERHFEEQVLHVKFQLIVKFQLYLVSR